MADSKFVIDGSEYEIPGFDTFDMDEAMLMYENTGFGLEDLVYDEEADDAQQVAARFRHPGLIKTLLHVAYQRGNPGMNRKRVATLIGQANYADAFVQLISSAEESDVEDPPEESMNKPPGSSPESSSLKPSSTGSEPMISGNGSSTSSDAREDDQPTTATPESVAPFLVTPERMPAA